MFRKTNGIMTAHALIATQKTEESDGERPTTSKTPKGSGRISSCASYENRRDPLMRWHMKMRLAYTSTLIHAHIMKNRHDCKQVIAHAHTKISRLFSKTKKKTTRTKHTYTSKQTNIRTHILISAHISMCLCLWDKELKRDAFFLP